MADLLGNDRFVVINAKVIIDLDLGAVVQAHQRRGALATMVVREDANAQAWGAIDVESDGRVRGILGEGSHMFTGVHVLEAEFLRSVPRGACDIVRTAYRDLITRRGPIYAHVQPEGALFAENSTAERYLDANLALLRAGAPFPWPTVGVDSSATIDPRAQAAPSVRVGSGARVEAGARIRSSVIGHDAVVAAGVELVDSVVWPGAIVTRSANGAVLTPRQRVQVRRDPRDAGS